MSDHLDVVDRTADAEAFSIIVPEVIFSSETIGTMIIILATDNSNNQSLGLRSLLLLLDHMQ